MRYLITQSLLSSWGYLFKCREECLDDARNEFAAVLTRQPKEQTPEMANGIAFENEVYDVVRGVPRAASPVWEAGVQKVAERIIGAQIQVKLYREITIGDMTFLVYGILDALKAGVISDVKYLNKSIGSTELAGKYLDSPQHPTYFFLEPSAVRFDYIVSDGEDVYVESYTPEGSRRFEDVLCEFISWLVAAGQLETYKEYWRAKE